MTARSGSTDGRSGSVISPAPSCFRVVRELDRLVLRDPEEPLATGVDPVPVITDDELDWLFVKELPPEFADDAAETAAALFTAAWPQRLQYPSSISPAHPGRLHASPLI
jgi:hypothetical protein